MTSEYRQIAMAIEDRFFEEQQLSDIQDIVDYTGLSRSVVDGKINEMAGNGLVTVYEKSGSATLYITEQMFNSLHAQSGEPDWIIEYEFEDKQTLREDIRATTEQISEYQLFERLLYGTGNPLEESVVNTLEFMRFDLTSEGDDEDILIEMDGHTYVIEVKGVGGQIDKENVNQLGGWLAAKIDEGVEPENLTGILIHNHERETNPSERGFPLTGHAERFLKHHRAMHVSTKTLFDLVTAVKDGELSSEEAREIFLRGDPFSD